jgi:hypothetical protein
VETPASTHEHRLAPDSELRPLVARLIVSPPGAALERPQALRMLLHPDNLGTVQVDIAADHLDVHTRLLVEHPGVKEVLEASLHKLRDALQAQGLQVQALNVSVGQRFPQHDSMAGGQAYGERSWKGSRAVTMEHISEAIAAPPEQARIPDAFRQVDLFV